MIHSANIHDVLCARYNMEHGSIVVSEKAMVSASVSLAEDTDHNISSSKKCDRSQLRDPNLIQGLREGFLKDVTFNPRCGRKEVEER